MRSMQKTLLFIIVAAICMALMTHLFYQRKALSENPMLYFEHVQTFPIERYPGMKCFTLATPTRFVVATMNCNPIIVFRDFISVGQFTIPRITNKYCSRCLMNDYLSIVKLLLFGQQDKGIAPLAPNGTLILEDDVLICKDALPLLDICHQEQVNCMLGRGNSMTYFASPTTVQPHPERNSHRRFATVNELYSPEVNKHNHVDQYLWDDYSKMFAEQHVNHLGTKSVMGHRYGTKSVCTVEETLEHPIEFVDRFKDLPLNIPNKWVKRGKATRKPKRGVVRLPGQ